MTIYYEKPDNRVLFGISSTKVLVSKPAETEAKISNPGYYPWSAFPDEIYFHYNKETESYEVSLLHWVPLYSDKAVEAYRNFFKRMSVTESFGLDKPNPQIGRISYMIQEISYVMDYYARVALPLSGSGYVTETVAYHMNKETLKKTKSVVAIEPSSLVSLATQDWAEIYGFSDKSTVIPNTFYKGLLEDKNLIVGCKKDEKPAEWYYAYVSVSDARVWMKVSRSYYEAMKVLKKVNASIFTKEGATPGFVSPADDSEVPF